MVFGSDALNFFCDAAFDSDEQALVFALSAGTADRDVRGRADFREISFRVVVELLIHATEIGEELFAFFPEGFLFFLIEFRRMVDFNRDDRIDDWLIAPVVDFQDDVGSECFARVE